MAMTLGEKILKGRKAKGLTQQALADRCGVSKRTIASYETDGRLPHTHTLKILARELGYTADYLSDDTQDEFHMPTEEQRYIQNLRETYGDTMADEIDELLTKSVSLFAGGTLAQEAKDQYFLALTNAYIACKKEGESV